MDDAPRGLRDGQKAADIYVRSDALAGVEAILAGLDKKLGAGKPTAAAIRSKELAHRIATEPPDSMPFDIAPGVLDPREVIEAIDAVVPKDWDSSSAAAIRPISTPRCAGGRRSATRRFVNSARSATACRMR